MAQSIERYRNGNLFALGNMGPYQCFFAKPPPMAVPLRNRGKTGKYHTGFVASYTGAEQPA